jgi:hypothetical protein
MDISINLGMTPEEQELLFSVARKIWKDPNASPCMSLAKPNKQGGFGIPVAVSATDWRGTSGFIRAYYEKKNKDGAGGGGKGKPQQGQGQGGGQGGGDSSDQPQIDEKLNVGDFYWVPGSSPKVYGKVTAINETTGEIASEEYTAQEWENIKANIKKQQ